MYIRNWTLLDLSLHLCLRRPLYLLLAEVDAIVTILFSYWKSDGFELFFSTNLYFSMGAIYGLYIYEWNDISHISILFICKQNLKTNSFEKEWLKIDPQHWKQRDRELNQMEVTGEMNWQQWLQVMTFYWYAFSSVDHLQPGDNFCDDRWRPVDGPSNLWWWPVDDPAGNHEDMLTTVTTTGDYLDNSDDHCDDTDLW